MHFETGPSAAAHLLAEQFCFQPQHASRNTHWLAPQTTDPEDACEAVQPQGLDKPWIALVVRSRKQHPSCTFDTKVMRHHLTLQFTARLHLSQQP